jgi:hypothetical protein
MTATSSSPAPILSSSKDRAVTSARYEKSAVEANPNQPAGRPGIALRAEIGPHRWMGAFGSPPPAGP